MRSYVQALSMAICIILSLVLLAVFSFGIVSITEGQTLSGGGTFTTTIPINAPAITSISPNNGPTAGGTVVTINGTNLSTVTQVMFGSTPAASFTVNSVSKITATSPPVSNGGASDITVQIGSPVSSVDRFTYAGSPQPPSVISVSPVSGTTAGGTSITVIGTHFSGATSCKFGSTVASTCTVNNDSSITTSSPALAAGTYDITIITPIGTSPINSGDQFTENPTVPTVSSISPTTGPIAGGTAVTVTGTNFLNATAVKFCTTAASSFSVTNSTTISATSPAHGAGTCDVTVTTAGGTSAINVNDQFLYSNSPIFYTCTANRYVATNGLDTNSGLDAAHPWLTVGYAGDPARGLAAGTCVNFASGTYTVGGYTNMAGGGTANTLTGYVVYRSSTLGGAIIKANAANGNAHIINLGGGVFNGASSTHGNPYIIFDGFTVDGSNAGLVSNPVTDHCVYAFNTHHIMVLNSTIHDCGGAGVALNWSDFYTVYGNTVYNTSNFDSNATSGIGIYEPWADNTFTYNTNDTNATYHIIIQNNTVHDNIETFVSGNHTDGNGIIVDDFRNDQPVNPWVAQHTHYPYRTLIQGNHAYNNGGGGVHIFISDGGNGGSLVDSNVAYLNYTDGADGAGWRGDVDVQFGNNWTFTNNQSMSHNGAGTCSASNPLACQSAALDNGPNTGNTWTNNGTCEQTTGQISWVSDTISLATFTANNHLGSCNLPN